MEEGRTKLSTPPTAVLVAETECVSRQSLSELLREDGFRVVEAGQSQAAVAHIHGDPSIKVILSDLEMPSWTSIVTLARQRLPQSLILGMVRYGAIANAIEAQRLGAHAYLVKPLEFAEVQEWIQRFLTGRSQIK